jgi:heme-degrading monooxygenase HmoA
MFCNYGEGEIIMIARIWRGETAPEKANKYFEYLQATGLKEYQDTPGNQGVFVLRRIHDRRAEFLLLSLWQSWDAIRAFAGNDLDKAVYYPEDEAYLLSLEPEVTHYEILAAPKEIETKS